MTSWRTWLLGARVRTLPAAVVPVVVGTAAATDRIHRLADLRWGNAVLALVVALALQVGTNFANDYSDGKRGVDDPRDRVGPPRLVGSGLATADQVRTAMVVAFGVALLAGFGLVLTVGWELVPVGVAAVAAGWFYTGGPRPYGYAGLGELFVFVFFGVVATAGSTYVQLERVTGLSVGCGMAVGALATALLVVNNVRDLPTDARSGKRTLAVRLGERRSRVLYALLMGAPFVILPFVAGLGGRPLAVLAAVAIPLGHRPLLAMLSGARGRGLVPALADTARMQLLFGALLALGLVIVP